MFTLHILYFKSASSSGIILGPLLPKTLPAMKAFDAKELELTSKMKRKSMTLRIKDQQLEGDQNPMG